MYVVPAPLSTTSRASYICEAFTKFSKNISTDEPAEIFYKETNSARALKNILEADYKLGIIRFAENYDKYFRSMLEEKELTYEIVTDFTYKIAIWISELPYATINVPHISNVSAMLFICGLMSLILIKPIKLKINYILFVTNNPP